MSLKDEEEVVFSTGAENYDKVVEAWGLNGDSDSDSDDGNSFGQPARKQTGLGAAQLSSQEQGTKKETDRPSKATNSIKSSLKRQRELEKEHANDWKRDHEEDDEEGILVAKGSKARSKNQPLANRIREMATGANQTPDKHTVSVKASKGKKKNKKKRRVAATAPEIGDNKQENADLAADVIGIKVSGSSVTQSAGNVPSESADEPIVANPTADTTTTESGKPRPKKKNKRPKKRSKQKNIRKDNRPPGQRPTFAQTGRGIGKKHKEKLQPGKIATNAS